MISENRIVQYPNRKQLNIISITNRYKSHLEVNNRGRMIWDGQALELKCR